MTQPTLPSKDSFWVVRAPSSTDDDPVVFNGVPLTRPNGIPAEKRQGNWRTTVLTVSNCFIFANSMFCVLSNLDVVFQDDPELEGVAAFKEVCKARAAELC